MGGCAHRSEQGKVVAFSKTTKGVFKGVNAMQTIVMGAIVRRITAGPGELDIMIDIFRRAPRTNLYFSFEWSDTSAGGKWPVTVDSVGVDKKSGLSRDDVVITGLVMHHSRNRYRHHYFTAKYNVRTRTGEATFEVACSDCGGVLDEYGVCEKCDPCPRCGSREKPHTSCCVSR